MMAIIGAITRLTESGLSITEWKPITGALPPLTVAEWQRVFDLYQQTPEYRAKNMGMTLDEFKTIFFWEWLHRLWGRMIGVIYALPFLLFWLKGWISPRLTWVLFGLLILGGAQGFIGWFMVQSGLIDRPSVSPYRLALHLSCAAALYAALIAVALSLRPRAYPTPRASGFLRIHALFGLFCVAITIIWGAFVAGLDAGLIYNEFPTMGPGRLVPADMWHLTPAWLNLFENHAGVQFTHRVLGVVTGIVIGSLAAHGFYTNRNTKLYTTLGAIVFIQIGLGIATLLSGVNIVLAVMHQGTAFILLGLMVFVCHDLFSRQAGRPTPMSQS
jgi:cytochrome c oxidase assembly protein subunit 15